ncbi:hypothetical protein C8F01DRAFT_1137605 [Mycena amicta]|nr:hypothetical protein C8F01DRAFT_1137605 [Mycena amicta]
MTPMSKPAEKSHQSVAGPRNNPTVDDFVANRSVRTIPPEGLRGGERALDREGRAICRIVYGHGYHLHQIANVMSDVKPGTIAKAIKNAYVPADNVENDYDYVSADYKKRFPPKLKPQSLGLGRASGGDSEEGSDSEGESLSGDEEEDEEVVAIHKPIVKLPDSIRKNFVRSETTKMRGARMSRTKRAIARIVFLNSKPEDKWTQARIAKLLHVKEKTVENAILNEYPTDNANTDYDYVDDDLKAAFPPAQSKRKRAQHYLTESVEDLAEGSVQVSKKQKAMNADNVTGEGASSSNGPRLRKVKQSTVPSALRQRVPETAHLNVFLAQSIAQIDIPKYLTVFKKRGIKDLQRLRTIAQWDKDTVRESLKRLLGERMPAEGGVADSEGLDEFELIVLENALKGLRPE